jgi:hypothetical protein
MMEHESKRRPGTGAASSNVTTKTAGPSYSPSCSAPQDPQLAMATFLFLKARYSRCRAAGDEAGKRAVLRKIEEHFGISEDARPSDPGEPEERPIGGAT